MTSGENPSPPSSPPQLEASFVWQPVEREEPPPTTERVQFSLRQMMLAVTVIGISLGVVRWIGPSGWLATIMLVWLWLANDRRAPLKLSLQNAAVQILGGLLLPLAGILISLLKEHPQRSNEFVLGIMVTIFSQGLVIVAVVAYKRLAPWMNNILEGYLAIHALLIGFVLFSIGISQGPGGSELANTVHGLVYGIAGLITACCLFWCSANVSDYGTRHRVLPLALLGAMLAIVLPSLASGLVMILTVK